MVTTRLRHGRKRRPRVADILNQLSFLAAISFSVASIVFFAAKLALHFGLLTTVSLAGTTAVAANPQVLVAQGRPAALPRADPLADGGLVSPSPSFAPFAALVPTPNRANAVYMPILMYHYIRFAARGDKAGWNLSVTPPDFEAQMAWLSQNGYTPVTMRDAVLMMQKKKVMPARPVALTFDDGYEDFYTTAVPALRQYGFTATNYVPTRLVGLPSYLTWAQVQELDAAGFEMAAHTQFHVGLGRANLDRARTEVFGSLTDLEAHLGHPVTDFCYPYGSFDPSIIQLVKEAGFTSATSTLNGVWHDKSQAFYLTRVRVGGGESIEGWSHSWAASNLGWPTTTSFGAASAPPSVASPPPSPAGSPPASPQ